MKIVYLTNVRMPTEKAHGLQTVKMCEALAEGGINVLLVAPQRGADLKNNLFDFYGVKKNFSFLRMPSLDFVRFGKAGFFISAILFLFTARIYLFFKSYDVLYVRDPLAGLFFRDFILELHNLPDSAGFVYKYLLSQAGRIAALTSFIKNELIRLGIPADKIIVLPDAVDLKEFDIDISKNEARKKFGLPQDKKIVLYTGSFFLHDWKGIETLFGAARILGLDFLFVMVGIHPWEIKEVEPQLPANVLLISYLPHKMIPYYLKSADFLALPNKGGEKISEEYTSPLKLFEYMASKRPIISSDLPSLREILTEKEAVFFEAGNQNDLAKAIQKTVGDQRLGEQLSYNAYEKVKGYTWDDRVKKIINVIN